MLDWRDPSETPDRNVGYYVLAGRRIFAGELSNTMTYAVGRWSGVWNYAATAGHIDDMVLVKWAHLNDVFPHGAATPPAA